MNDIEKLNERINMLEGRCEYLGIVLSAFLVAWGDKAALQRALEDLALSNDAAALFSDSPIGRPQESVSRALTALLDQLRAMMNSQDQS